ncbi:protein SDA1 [Nematocida sp. AWRm77]|nr:protein SDA1 [Nematocida sp. AWRm77]
MDVRLQLQVKKDPLSYASLYANEVENLRGMIKISKLDPAAKNPELCNLLVFLPHVSMHYEEDIAGDIFHYTLDYYAFLDKGIAQAAITGVITLKKSKQLGPDVFYKQALPLIEGMDKRTKTLFLQFLVSEIIRDKEHWEVIQNILFGAIKSGVEAHSKRAVYIFLHMVSREAWKDQKSTEKVFELILNATPGVANFIFMYLLDKVELVIREEEIEIPDEVRRRSKIKKETKGDTKKKERQKKELEKKIAKREEKAQQKQPNLIALLERLGEKGPEYGAKIFRKVKSADMSSEIKLRMAQVVSRIIYFHKITIKGFLGYMTRFMFPHQKNLPAVFSSIAQSIHSSTPASEIEAICEMIGVNFCSDHKDDEIIAYGINSLKAIIRRYPEATKFPCIQYVLDFRGSKKKQAATASTALKKMMKEVTKAAAKTENDSDAENDSGAEEEQHSYSGKEDDNDNGSEEEDGDSEEFGAEELVSDSDSIEDSNEFITEEAISKIRKKDSKEEMIDKAKADKYSRKKKDLPSTNKEKQKETNYAVRRTKRKVIPKKKRAPTKKVKRY